jgi:hypothetical protein
MNNKTRELKAYYNNKHYPQIILQGKWLKELGFNIHDKIIVRLYKDKLIIEKIKEPKVTE